MRAADEERFRQYVATRARPLRRTAFLLCGDWHAAEDLVQSALAALYVAWPRLRDPDRVDAYVRTTLVRRAVDERRRPWHREHAAADVAGVADGPVPDGFAVEDRWVVHDALRALPPRQRAVIVLRFLDDVSVAETARLLRCSEGTVKGYTARAVATLRTALGAALPERSRP